MIEIKKLSISFENFCLKDLSLTILDKEYFVILGPSGAGKTIFMECIAGIHKVKKGEVWIDNINVTRSLPEERGIGYVPQDYVLFPFLNVRDNIIFGLRRDKHTKLEIQKKLLSLADLLGITHLLDRDTRTLSGGEKQRVALARALAPSPRMLLLDEPLSSLDVQTSKYLRLELRRIHQELGVTTIHVTHNHMEAEELADRIAIMCDGSIEQVGKPHDIFFSPATDSVCSFVGSLNILECSSCRQLVPGLVEVESGGIHIVIPHDEGPIQKIAISPRDVYVYDSLPPGSSVNRFKGVISLIDYSTTVAKLDVKVGSLNIQADMPSELAKEMKLIIGAEVYLILKLRRLKVLGNKNNKSKEQFEWYYQEII
jgi:molybdate/tungstate transport system ATP-binding protein